MQKENPKTQPQHISAQRPFSTAGKLFPQNFEEVWHISTEGTRGGKKEPSTPRSDRKRAFQIIPPDVVGTC